MNNPRIQQAITRSKELSSLPLQPNTKQATPSRFFAIGDPQTTRSRLFSILDSYNLLGDDGMLHPDVGLVSIGDHFDYAAEPHEVRQEGLLFLRWLAEHPVSQVHIIAGNHDLCRVMELAPFTDATYAQAQRDAKPIKDAEHRGEDTSRTEEEFYQSYPSLPSPGCALKDFLGFSEAQRELVQSLLLQGRFKLALAAQTEGQTDALLTHAAVTHRELSLLGLDASATAHAIAKKLNQHLAMAVDKVRERWHSGDVHTALNLEPIHIAGFAGQEGGGLLYHRPADPSRASADKLWEFDPKMPRRFDPRRLPLGLLQICGHTGHSKCLTSLGGWVENQARTIKVGGLRTLSLHEEQVSYRLGISNPREEAATLYMIDIEIHKQQDRYDLLPLGSVHP